MMPVPVVSCSASDDRWFTGIVCTDGATATVGPTIRHREQREAASIGAYSVMAQLGHTSVAVRDSEFRGQLVDELADLLERSRPVNVYTHDLADRHPTHVAVALATIDAIRRLDPAVRPGRVVGCEGWRGLAWMSEQEKIRMSLDTKSDLPRRLVQAHSSQLATKAYDSAFQGRRRANATLHDIHSPDETDEVMVAMELTPLVRNDDLDPVEFVRAAIDRFGREVEMTLLEAGVSQAGGSPGHIP